MNEHAPCPLCECENPSDNRFCGHCGTSLASTNQLVSRRDHSPAAAVRYLPSKLGPTGKAVAVALTTLAAEAGLLWLRRRLERADGPPLPANQDPKPAVPEYLLSHSLEEVAVWLQEGDSRSQIFVRREERSFGAVKPADGRE